jgi:hypothetical protein
MMLHSVDAGVIIGVTLGQFDEPYIHWYSLRGGCVGNPATRQGS